MKKLSSIRVSIVAFFISFFVTIVTIFLIFFGRDVITNLIPKPETAVKTTGVSYIDTFTVLNSVIKNNQKYVVIDTRDKMSYQKAHIKKSINIPALTILQGKYDKKSLRQLKGDSTLVVLSYSMFSTEGELLQKKLVKDGFDPFVLKAGWNEIFNLPNLWVPEGKQIQFSLQSTYINFAEK